jgi:polysaccharide export outer membrane protein
MPNPQLRKTSLSRDEYVNPRMYWAVMILALCCATSVKADPPQSAEPGNQPALKLSTEALMHAMEPAEDEEYTLDAGDELTIEVLDRAELSGKHVMGPDGRITLPLYGPIKLTGLTREGAAAAITAALSKYFVNPSVNVRVEKYGSNRILLIGRVSSPGLMYFDRVPTLLEVISRAGNANPNGSQLPSRCAIFRGKDQTLWLNLRTMMNTGSPALQMRLKRNDTVFIPDDADEYVTVMEEVGHPGVVQLSHDMNINDALALSGGLSEKASQAHIQLIRASDGKTTVLTMADVLHSRNGAEVLLHKGDVVFVPRSGMSKATDVLQAVAPIGSLLMLGTTVGALAGR